MSLIQTDCDRYQYDIFQRYDLLRHVLTAAFANRTCEEPVRVLDVGSGPNSLSEEFLPPWFHVTRSDVSSFDDPAIVLLTARKPLPFADDAFDVVLAIDVLEHLPAGERELLIQECARVSSQLAMFTFPRRSPRVERAEAVLNSAFRAAFGQENNFLNEHTMMGLPEPSKVRSTLERMQVSYVEASTSPLARWMLSSVLDVFYCAQFGIGEEKGDFNQQMNAFCGRLHQGDEYYRACFFAIKNLDLEHTIDQALATSDRREQSEQEWQFLAMQELVGFFAKYRGSWSGRYENLAQVKDQCIAQQRDAIDAKDRHAAGLDEALKAHQKELARANASLAEVTASHERVKASLELKQKQFAEAVAEIAEKVTIITERSAQVATIITEMAVQKKQILAQEQAILDFRLRNATLDEINAEQRCLIRELKERVEELQAERAQLRKTLDARIRHLDRITMSISWRFTRTARVLGRWIHWIRRPRRKTNSTT